MKKLLLPVLLGLVYFGATARDGNALGKWIVAAFGSVVASMGRTGDMGSGFSGAAPQAQVLEAGFSPEGGGEALVLKAINAARAGIHVATGGLVSTAIAKALIEAKRRGVDVRVIVGEGGAQFKPDSAVLSLLANADILIRTVARRGLRQDSFLVVDQRTVQTGSFDYGTAATRGSSENVILIWNNPDLAEAYLRHWRRNFDEGKPYRSWDSRRADK